MVLRKPAGLKIDNLEELQAAIDAYFMVMAIRPRIYVRHGERTPDTNARVTVLIDDQYRTGSVQDVSRDPRKDWLEDAVATLGFYSHKGLDPTCIVGSRLIFSQFRLKTHSWLTGAKIIAAEPLGELFE